MGVPEISAHPVQSQQTKLPKLDPAKADLPLKTKFALANALANPKSAPTKMEEYVQGWKDDFKNVKDAPTLFNAVVKRTNKGFQSIDAATGLPQGTTAKAWGVAAALSTGVPQAAAKAVATAGTSLTASQAVTTVGALVGSSVMAACDKILPTEEHNHYEELPVDTVTEEKYVEKVVEKPVYITQWKDSIVRDTIEIPGKDSIVHDTIKVPEPYPVPVPTPPETILVNKEFHSDVPEKIKEIVKDLAGKDTTGIGEFVYGINYEDSKNYTLHQMRWDGGRTSRDGDVYVMNGIGTVWSDEDENYVLGKNETFYKNELYTNSGDLAAAKNNPRGEINANSNGSSNWYIFNPDNAYAQPGFWERQLPETITKVDDSTYRTSSGFILRKGDKEGTINVVNPQGADWDLLNVDIIGGDDAKDPQ